jgi:hypothetical protein
MKEQTKKIKYRKPNRIISFHLNKKSQIAYSMDIRRPLRIVVLSDVIPATQEFEGRHCLFGWLGDVGLPFCNK